MNSGPFSLREKDRMRGVQSSIVAYHLMLDVMELFTDS